MEEQMNQPEQQAPQAPQSEAPQPQGGGSDQNKLFAIIGYIFPILFFIPLVSDAKNDPFARFHANQQLVFLIYWVAVSVLGPIIAAITLGIGALLLPIFWIFGIVAMVMGVINASKMEMKKLPLIGGITLIK